MIENVIEIDRYTREEAIKDGVLIDVSKMAREAGIKYPVAVTRTVWYGIVTPADILRELGQSEDGRLWDVLWMYRHAARKSKSNIVIYQLYAFFTVKQMKQMISRKKRFVKLIRFSPEYKVDHYQMLFSLKAVIHPGDNMEPVITISLPYED